MEKNRLVEILNALTYSRKRAELIDELMVSCTKAGFDPATEMGAYIVCDLTKESETYDEPVDKTLRDELTAILRSGWDFSGPHYAEEAREFCSEEGDVLDCIESELSEKQKRFLSVIRKFYRRWIHDIGGKL